MSENYDATWLDYMPTVNYGQNYVYTTTGTGSFWPYQDEVRRISYDPPEPAVPAKPKRKTRSDKEKNEDMASNHTFSDEDREEIDESVREAIVGPKRVAEVATRRAAVEALGIEDNREVGTVLTFKRKIAKNEHLFVAIKVDEDKWVINGSAGGSSATKNWEDFLTWMTTGETIVSDVKVATAFEDITWETSTVVPAQTPVVA